MTSERKRQANRDNARKSTGPTSDAGKSRSARNALRHGLSITSLLEPSWAPEVYAFAQRLVPEGVAPIIRQCANEVAAAQIDLMRVRLARQELVSRALNDDSFEPASQAMKRRMVIADKGKYPPGSFERLMEALSQKPDGDRKMALVFSELHAELMRLDRYERRALSRRRKAMKLFDIAAQNTHQSLDVHLPLGTENV